MNIFERTIAYFSPATALRRERARLALDVVGRKYEGAAKGRRTQNWLTRGTSANTEISADLFTLRERSRDLVRNCAPAFKAIQVIQNNTIGTGIRPNIANAKAKKAWQAWGETTDCDYGGQMDFYGLQKLIMRTVAESGEALVLKRRVAKTASGVPIRLQVLECDHIDHLKTFEIESGYIINGIEFNNSGERVAYWLFERHPGDLLAMSADSKRIPATEVLHIYDIQRPSQVRGIPFGASTFINQRDYDEFVDAQLVRQKIAACFSVFIQDQTELTTARSEEREEAGRVEPGVIEYLPPGKTVTFASPPPADGYSDYSRNMLQRIASGYGITYESMTGDLANTSFSSGRMGWLEMARNIGDWQGRIIIPMFCKAAFEWFVTGAELAGRGGKSVTATWTTPKREMINPAQDVPAVINSIRAGLISQSEALRMLGYDPDEVFAEMAADNAKLDNLGLILDSDPRKVMKAGTVQPYLDTTVAAAGFEDSPPQQQNNG